MTGSTRTSRAVFSDARILVFGAEEAEIIAIENLLAQWDYHNVVSTNDATRVAQLPLWVGSRLSYRTE